MTLPQGADELIRRATPGVMEELATEAMRCAAPFPPLVHDALSKIVAERAKLRSRNVDETLGHDLLAVCVEMTSVIAKHAPILGVERAALLVAALAGAVPWIPDDDGPVRFSSVRQLAAAQVNGFLARHGLSLSKVAAAALRSLADADVRAPVPVAIPAFVRDAFGPLLLASPTGSSTSLSSEGAVAAPPGVPVREVRVSILPDGRVALDGRILEQRDRHKVRPLRAQGVHPNRLAIALVEFARTGRAELTPVDARKLNAALIHSKVRDIRFGVNSKGAAVLDGVLLVLDEEPEAA